MESSRYGPLVKTAIILFDKFQRNKQHLDDFREDALKEMKDMDAMDQRFILDIVTGCVEHTKLLEKVIQVFYAQNWKYLIKDDRKLYFTICYIAVFALEDIGFQNFCNIVQYLDVNKMHKFLSFFFNDTILTTEIQDAWSRIYDADYVESNWIAPLLRWRPQIDILLDQLARISAGSQVTRDSVKSTVPQEFTFSKTIQFTFSKTRHRPVNVPEVEPIPQPEKNPTVPDSTYIPPKELAAMEEMKVKNRAKAEQLLYEANMDQFKCANPNKSKHTMDKMSKIREQFESNFKLYSPPSSGVRALQKTNNIWPIKLNNTAILREGALYNRKMEDELQKLERLVKGAREPSTFLQWQKERREQDLQEELAQLERRHLEGRISQEEAAMARMHIMERNQKAVQQNKEERTELLQRYAQKRLEEEREMRDLVRQVAEGHKNSKAVKVRLREFKQRIAKEVSTQNQKLLRQALEDAQAELRRKFEIIREIHAMESVPRIRHRFLDDTEVGGHDLLEEMSLAELRERLVFMKKAEKREAQERRERIQVEKQVKRLLLQDQLEANNLHRRAMAMADTRRQEVEKMGRQSLLEKVAEDDVVQALRKKLEEKKQECQSLKEKEKKKSKSAEWAAEPINSWKLKQDIQHWTDLERCLQRQIRKEASCAGQSAVSSLL